MSGDESDKSDEDLKKAIALSLQESTVPPPPERQAVIDLVSEDEDDDLDAPLTTKAVLSTRECHSKQGPADTNIALSLQKIVPPISGLLGLNRKQMEEERLARLNARKDPSHDGAKISDDTRKRKAAEFIPERPDGRNVKAKILASSELPATNGTANGIVHEGISDVSAERATNSGPSCGPSSSTESSRSNSIQYPHGVVKKTWAYGFPRDGNDIKIEEVLQKNDLELAVLSTFQIDADWITSKLDEKTKVVWVLQAKSEAEKQNWLADAPKNFRFCFPAMDGVINCMHSKLQLLAHGSFLRIVITSANLVPYDWGESGVMENVCFLIDLPKLQSGQSAELNTHFGIELSYFLTALSLDQKIVDSLRKFDFTPTADIAFVHSIGGSHEAAWQRTGYCGLGSAVQNLGAITDQALDIDFLAASIGSLNKDFIRAMYLACQGDDGLTEYRWRIGKSARSKVAEEAKRKLPDDFLSRCRIYFPTEQTVSESKGGFKSGGTICFQEKYYNSEQFPRSLMRDCVSRREGLLMHSKMIFIRGPRTALAYVGSANLSESAWGRLVKKDKTTLEPKLNCRNWECGILLPVPSSALHRKPLGREEENKESPGMEIFDGVVPVPMLTPGEEYGVRKPWFFAQR